MPMPAPTCGLNVIAVNAPSATPSDRHPGDGDEPTASRGVHPDCGDEASDQPDETHEDHADDERPDAGFDRHCELLADVRVQPG